MTTIRPEVLDELLAGYERPEDLLGEEGGKYNLTTDGGELRISRVIEHSLGYIWETPLTREAILERMAGSFDTSLLVSGDRCECGHAFEIGSMPRYCPRCQTRLLPLPVWSLEPASLDSMPEALVQKVGRPRHFWTGSVDDGRFLWILCSDERVVGAAADSMHEDEYFDLLSNESLDRDHSSSDHVLESLERPLAGALDLAAVRCGACRAMRSGTSGRCDSCGRRTRSPDDRERLFGWLPTWYCVRVEWYRSGREFMRYDTLHGALRARDYQFLENSMECRFASYAGRRINWTELIFGWLDRS